MSSTSTSEPCYKTSETMFTRLPALGMVFFPDIFPSQLQDVKFTWSLNLYTHLLIWMVDNCILSFRLPLLWNGQPMINFVLPLWSTSRNTHTLLINFFSFKIGFRFATMQNKTKQKKNKKRRRLVFISDFCIQISSTRAYRTRVPVV